MSKLLVTKIKGPAQSGKSTLIEHLIGPMTVVFIAPTQNHGEDLRRRIKDATQYDAHVYVPSAICGLESERLDFIKDALAHGVVAVENAQMLSKTQREMVRDALKDACREDGRTVRMYELYTKGL